MSTARERNTGRKSARVCKRLSRDHGNTAGTPDLRQRLDVFGLAGLLEPVGLEFRQRMGEVDGVHRRQAAVDVEQKIDVRADRVAHRAHDLDGTPDVLLRDIGPPRTRHRIELHGGEAAREHRLGAAGVILRLLHLVAPAVRIDANARTDRAAEEIVDGLLARLADDVPQRLLDARGRAVEFQRAAALGIIVEGDLQDMADVKGIAPHDVAAELFHLRGDGAVAIILAVGFAPPHDSGIGLDAHEHEILAPAGMDRKAFELGNFHGSPAMVCPTRFLQNELSASYIARTSRLRHLKLANFSDAALR